ncbi:MAG: Eco57I restriction-modification methylase domain-containing protein [Candidatus Helarchaeota archaeon]
MEFTIILFYRLVFILYYNKMKGISIINNDLFEFYKSNQEIQNSNYYKKYILSYIDKIFQDLTNKFEFKALKSIIIKIFKKDDQNIKNIIVSNDIFNPNKLAVLLDLNIIISNNLKEGILDELFDPEIFSYLYEFYKDEERKKFGIYYTNKNIVNFMVKKAISEYILDKTELSQEKVNLLFLNDDSNDLLELDIKEWKKIFNLIKNIKILDPSIGTGEFLVSILKCLVKIRMNCIKRIYSLNEISKREIFEWIIEITSNNLFGLDIDDGSIEITILRLIFCVLISDIDLNLKECNFNIFKLDYTKLSEKNNVFKCRFNIIIGNPPYAGRGRGVDKQIAREFGLISKDLFGIFMIQSLNYLKTDGILSFLVSDTWRTIKSHRPLRKIILENTKLKIIIILPIWMFKATVNTSILLLKKISKEYLNYEQNSKIYTYDLMTLSVDDQKIMSKILNTILMNKNLDKKLEKKIGFYSYNQNLLPNFSKMPIIVADKNLFLLMNDTTCKQLVISSKGFKIKLNCIYFNNKKLSLFKFGDISEVKQGLGTGDNRYYIRKTKNEIYGNYKIVDNNLVLKDWELLDFSKKYREYYNKYNDVLGINKNDYEGRTYIPYDKGGEAYIKKGWLPNYWVPTNYYIDWSEEAIKRLKTLTIAQRNMYYHGTKTSNKEFENKKASRFQNTRYYFKKGITYSDTGYYAPTFRVNHSSVFDIMGMTIFTNYFSLYFCLGLLSSKLIKYLIKNFINSTVHTQVEGIKSIPIPLIDECNESIMKKVEKLVLKIIEKQQQNPKYPYFNHEQILIDKLIYELYNLNENDIKEVENWYKRRYPEIIKYQKSSKSITSTKT